MIWQLQTAKQKLSEVVDRALAEGPQVISRRGEGDGRRRLGAGLPQADRR